MLLTGPETKRIYVYYPNPIRRIKDGDRFTLDLSPKPVKLRSSFSGEEWDTEDEGYAVLFKGKIIGAADYLSEGLKNIMRLGAVIQIEAMRNGWYEEGKIPNVVTFWPDHGEMKSWIKAQELFGRPLPFEARLISFNISFENGDVIPKERLSEVVLSLMPVPEGSSAKPHIGFWSNGKLFFDVDAKSDAYKKLLPLVGNTVKMSIETRKSKIDEGKYIHIEYVSGFQ